MRVAFVSFDYGEYSVRNANALAEHEDADVLLALPKTKAAGLGFPYYDGVQTHLFERARFRQPIGQARMIRRLLKEIHAFAPDVVHFQGAHLWFNFVLPRLRKYPLVVTAHNPVHHVGDMASRRTPQWVMDHGFRQGHRIVVHGKALREQLASQLRIAPDRIDVVPHIAMGSPDLGSTVAEDPNCILFFGRIWQYKGLEFLIRAQPAISAEFPDAKIVIAGEGEDFDKYEKMMQQPDAFETHIERVSDAKREELFARSAVVVLPYISATQSGVIPIAFNHSKPVVATNVGALSEVVVDNQTGLLVESHDSDAIARAVNRLLGDESLRRKLGQAGHRMLNSQFSDQAVAEAHVAVYRKAIEGHPRQQQSRNERQGS